MKVSIVSASRVAGPPHTRSEEHTSELQSHSDLHPFPTRRSSDLNEEARVEQMHNSVLDAADILIDRQPLLHLFLAPCLLTIARVDIAQEVPGRADEGIHCICLAGRGASTYKIGRAHV